MAPMVSQDSFDLSLLDDFYNVLDSTDLTSTFFEEIDMLGGVEAFQEYDNTKLAGSNGVGLPTAPQAVMVQPPSPGPVPDVALPQVLEYGPTSPASEIHLLQPVSPGLSVESALSPLSSEAFTPDPDYLQPTTPAEVFPGSPPSPAAIHYVVASPQPCSVEPLVLHAAPLTPVMSVKTEEEEGKLQLVQPAADAPKKRGRKRKYPEGAAPRRNRIKKTKVYEMGPLMDEKEEKKRKNAINAKRHRDMQKAQRDTLAQQLEAVIAERNNLRKQVQQRNTQEQQLQAVMAERDNLLKQVQQLQQNQVQLQLMLVNQDQQKVLL